MSRCLARRPLSPPRCRSAMLRRLASRSLLAAISFLTSLVGPALTIASDPVRSAEIVASVPTRRLPSSIIVAPGGERLVVGHEATGTLSLVDIRPPHRIVEVRVGSSVADLETIPGTDLFASVDPVDHRLRLHRLRSDRAGESGVVTLAEVAPPRYPVQLAISRDGTRLAVASLWSRQLSTWRLAADASALQHERTVDLPFAPRQLQFLPGDERLIVADAFGGRLIGLDAASGRVLRDRDVPAHKIRGLALTPDGRRLVMSHQMLNGLAHAIRNDVHWGLMMSNDLRWLDLDVLLGPTENFYHDSHMHPLGQPGAGMADPAGIAMSSRGEVAVAIQGVDRVLIGREEDFSLDPIAVGPGPVDVAFSDDGAALFVAHRWDDSVSIIDVERRDPVVRLPLGNLPDETPIEQGRRLFHQGRLAHDGWMSCASCHVDGHSNGQLNDNFSDGSFGAPKRVLTLLGVAETEPLAWNGKQSSLEAQVRASIEATMQAPEPPSEAEVAAIAAFVRSLDAPPSIDAARDRIDASFREGIARGEAVFRRSGCSECHAGNRFTSPETYDVGLEDEQGNRRFNPPSLRGLSQRGPYLHDGRAADLDQLFGELRHQLDEPLSEADRTDLITFLRSL